MSINLFLGAHDQANLPQDFQVLFALFRVSDEGNAGVWKENWLSTVNARQNVAQNPQQGWHASPVLHRHHHCVHGHYFSAGGHAQDEVTEDGQHVCQ